MEKKDISKENTEAIFNSIVSNNRNLFEKIKKKHHNLTVLQSYIILLLQLDYISSEIRIMLWVTAENIEETIDLICNSEFS